MLTFLGLKLLYFKMRQEGNLVEFLVWDIL